MEYKDMKVNCWI